MSMQRLKSLILIGTAAALVASCSTTPSGRTQFTVMSDAEMARESSRQLRLFRESQALVKDRATLDYIACVTNAIIDVVGEDGEDMYWEMAVVDQPVANAMVMPGGKIVVFDGILSVATNQHQLAAVMGHEVAHATARHSNERASRAMVTSAGIDIAAIVLGGGWANQTNAARGALSTGLALGVDMPFSRAAESEADLIGLDYMAMAGFDPRESVKLWQNMLASNETRKQPEFLSTHPSGETRIEHLVDALPRTLLLFNKAREEGKDPQCQR